MIDNFINVTLIIAIAILLPFFTTQLHLKYNPVPKMNCSLNDNTDEYNMCYDQKQKTIKTYEQKKFIIMIMISTMYIVIGLFGSKCNANIALRGISLGGVFLLFFNIIRHWITLDQEIQLFFLGLSLTVFIYFGNQIKLTMIN